MDLKKQTKVEIISIFIALALLVVFAYGNITGFAVAGTITSYRLVWSNGSTATLVYDDNTSTYADFSTENNNMFVEMCSNDTSTDLLNQYVKLVYRILTSEVDLTVLPAQITSGDISGSCAVVDIDTNLFSAYYPGVVTIAKDSSPSFPSPTYYPLTETTGFLSGNYSIAYEQVGSDLVFSVYEVFDDQGNLINTSLPYMVIGVYNASGLINTTIVYPGQNITIPYPGTNFSFVVNSFNVSLTYDRNAIETCTNNVDDNADGLIDCLDSDCAAHPACLAPVTQIITGGGGGGGASYCEQKWECGPWGNCLPNSTRTRICYDTNLCLEKKQINLTRLVISPFPKPNETEPCDYIPACDDQVQNQDESDIDCGGDICAKCPLNKKCKRNNDCMSDNCFKNTCIPYGIECYEDNDCSRSFVCQEYKCVFTGDIRMPLPRQAITAIELVIILILLAVTLISSSFYAYQKYIKTDLYKQRITKQEAEKATTVLIQFINQAKAQGFSNAEIKKALTTKGWPVKTINQYLKQTPQTTIKPKAKLQQELKYYQEQLQKLKK